MNQTTANQAAGEIVQDSLANDGGTFALDGTPASEGYVVGIRTLTTVDDLNTYKVLSAIGYIAEEGVPGNYLGTWYDPDNEVWEIQESAIFADRGDALALARALDERFIYDLNANECIATS